MESIKQIFLILIKGFFLLLGIAMLIGGGLCSVSIPFFESTKVILLLIAFLAIVSVAVIFALTIKLSVSQHLKYVALLIGGFFLIGGGLCSINKSSTHTALNGLLLIDIAIALCGYLLIRWMLAIWKKSPP